MALDLFAVFFGGAIALLPIYATDILHVGAVGLGVLRTAPSIGALLVMLIATRRPPSGHAGRTLLICVAGFGVSMIVFGASTVFWLSLVALFVSGVTDGISMIIRNTILRVLSPERIRGRVASVNWVFIGASNELGAFESGVAARVFGTVPSVVGGGILTLGVVAATAVLVPSLRSLNLETAEPGDDGLGPIDTTIAAEAVVSGLGRVEVQRPQRGHEHGRHPDDAEGQDPAADDARDRAEDLRGEAALEGAELVRGADEDPVHGRDPAADPLRRQHPQDRVPDHHADAVGHPGHEEGDEGDREDRRGAEDDHADPEAGDAEQERPPAWRLGGRRVATSITSRAPSDGAVRSTPSPTAPTWRMSVA